MRKKRKKNGKGRRVGKKRATRDVASVFYLSVHMHRVDFHLSAVSRPLARARPSYTHKRMLASPSARSQARVYWTRNVSQSVPVPWIRWLVRGGCSLAKEASDKCCSACKMENQTAMDHFCGSKFWVGDFLSLLFLILSRIFSNQRRVYLPLIYLPCTGMQHPRRAAAWSSPCLHWIFIFYFALFFPPFLRQVLFDRFIS